MRELRSAVNALFLFVLFLFVYALVSPGHASGSSHGPRFLRMTIEDQEGRHGRPERVSLSVPYGFIRGGLKFASLGRLHRELDLRLTEPVEAEEVRAIWKELQETPEGGEIVRKRDADTVRIRKEGGQLTVVQTKECCPDEVVTLRIPMKLLEAVAARDRTFDVDAILSGLQNLERGELLDLRAKDAHVRVWIE
ncbi:MAG TPA: hypothetical protein VL084_05300 [Thermoanaerobaculia bacterium]|nr:hypothetical protein [Thermoanaerobaculia bacterium]